MNFIEPMKVRVDTFINSTVNLDHVIDFYPFSEERIIRFHTVKCDII